MNEAEAQRRGSGQIDPLDPQPRPPLHVAGGGAPPDQALRLRQFREEHPDVEVILRGPWQAIIAEPDGERIIVRWELRDLLDELDRRLGPGDQAAADQSAHVTGSRP